MRRWSCRRLWEPRRRLLPVSTGAGAGLGPVPDRSRGRAPWRARRASSAHWVLRSREAAAGPVKQPVDPAPGPLLWVSGLGGLVFSAPCACLCVSGGASASHRAGRREQGPRLLCKSHSASHVRDHPQCPSSLNSNRWHFRRSGRWVNLPARRRAHPARRHAERFLTCVTFLCEPKRTMKRRLITVLQTRKQAQRKQYTRHGLRVG